MCRKSNPITEPSPDFFTENAVNFKAPDGIDLSKGECVLANYDDTSVSANGFTTKPYETRVYIFK